MVDDQVVGLAVAEDFPDMTDLFERIGGFDAIDDGYLFRTRYEI